MGWRFRKSVKIAPGTRLNLSKSGVSVTNRVGKTGLSHRTQILGGRRSSSSKSSGGCLGRILGGFVALFIIGLLLSRIPPKSTDTDAPGVEATPELPIVAVSADPEQTPEPTPDLTPDPIPLESLTPEEAYAQTMERLARLGGKTVEEYQQEMYGKEEVFILNKKTKIYHDPSCAVLKTADQANIETFVGTWEELAKNGYTPCGRCHP